MVMNINAVQFLSHFYGNKDLLLWFMYVRGNKSEKPIGMCERKFPTWRKDGIPCHNFMLITYLAVLIYPFFTNFLQIFFPLDWVQKYVHMLTNFDHIKIAVFLLNSVVVTFIAMNYKQKGEVFAFFKL